MGHTTIRLMNKYQENGGEWYQDSKISVPSNYIRSLMRDMQAEEPTADWHLETRGMGPWHRWAGIDGHEGVS